MSDQIHQVAIIGGGVCGTALLYMLAEYTDLNDIVLLEKYAGVAKVNSNGRNNSQTIHCGDIETNYTLEKATKVKAAAEMLVNFAEDLPNVDQVIFKYPKMVLGVGEQECRQLRQRYQTFREVFPKMKLLEKSDIATYEPSVVMVNGEMRAEPCVALAVLDDYSAVDYLRLSEAFVDKAKAKTDKQIQLVFNSEVDDIVEKDGVFSLVTGDKIIQARSVVVSAGGHSLLLAQKMGYGLEFSCLPVAGSFYFTPQILRGKVYTVQNDALPFAAVHGDPDVLVEGKTRFGPTALLLPLLERYNNKTFFDFLRVLRLDSRVMRVFWDLFRIKDIRNYIFKNFLFEVPLLRRWLFLKDARKIVPGLQLKDIEFAKGFGGVRPQLIDKKNAKLLMGEAKINPGTGIVFNMTPSPGGTSCLENAETDMRLIASRLGATINESQLKQTLHKSATTN
ncbi:MULTISPECIES: FAD-dependent oxidoreductase [unclassified Methylophaga]|jgi:malate dehydrogenase (quinone)|uniref:FAD-dependent oxidoreductase n=2 Tax=Methylophaga TaxID=40222 RepID=UPI000C444E78|nr:MULTISPECIES: FAD-dependent oxidoreductase [unclassified Methylophaga]MBP25261.1 malate:quinone oxidoreductase [Methylophaga sp.]HCC83045.1 malate:quinone oxidoreductase [Methylophaga sp.]|tara:strand:+ start:537 stop:1883 length:1347 start_codon:yes stop_codon:yes gene_type:complete